MSKPILIYDQGKQCLKLRLHYSDIKIKCLKKNNKHY